MSETMFTVGVIAGTHGLRGEVKVLSRTDFPALRFARNSKLWLVHPKLAAPQSVTVESSRLHKSTYIVQFREFQSINEIEAFKGGELQVRQSDLAPLPEHTYYIHDLIGCDVVTDRDEQLGVVEEVLQPGANDVYVVKRPNKSPLLLPVIPECILSVDLSMKQIRVHLMDGLLDDESE